MKRVFKNGRLDRFLVSPEMYYVEAFCLLLLLRNTDEASVAVQSHPLLFRSSEPAPGGVNTTRSIFDLAGLDKDKRLEIGRRGLLTSLEELSSTAAEILDRISRNWAVEGAKTVQSGEIRLRKLNKDLMERIKELAVNGTKYGQHVLMCMNRTVFEMELTKILQDTEECYSESIVSVREELKKLEVKEKELLERVDGYGREIFQMLCQCFFKDETTSIIECLQKVDSINIGNGIRDVEGTQIILDMAGIVNNIPKAFSECTSRGLSQTEVHLRKSYQQSLTCLKDNIT